MYFELSHYDTCLPDYFQGHHLPYLQIPIQKGMTLLEIKESLKNELDFGAIGGSLDYDILESELFHYLADQAIENLTPDDKKQNTFFNDLDDYDDDCEFTVYAFFILVPFNFFGDEVQL